MFGSWLMVRINFPGLTFFSQYDRLGIIQIIEYLPRPSVLIINIPHIIPYLRSLHVNNLLRFQDLLIPTQYLGIQEYNNNVFDNHSSIMHSLIVRLDHLCFM